VPPRGGEPNTRCTASRIPPSLGTIAVPRAGQYADFLHLSGAISDVYTAHPPRRIPEHETTGGGGGGEIDCASPVLASRTSWVETSPGKTHIRRVRRGRHSPGIPPLLQPPIRVAPVKLQSSEPQGEESITRCTPTRPSTGEQSHPAPSGPASPAEGPAKTARLNAWPPGGDIMNHERKRTRHRPPPSRDG